MRTGAPAPIGATVTPDGVNFSLFSRTASRVDLLLFDGETRDSADFVLPHPRAADRLFVLAPAAQVAPEAVWPEIGLTIRELLDELDSDESVVRLEAHGSL